MSYILTVYSTKAFKEYLLPAIDNADYTLILQREVFDLPEDLEIYLEIIKGEWRFAEEQNYELKNLATGADCNGAYIDSFLDVDESDTAQGGFKTQVIKVVGAGNESISILPSCENSKFSVMKKYGLTNVNVITIGRDPNNTFCYSNELIGRNHATITQKGGRFVIEDLSANGTFVNNKRIKSARALEFGDCIDIFGFKMVFLDSYLAVDMSKEDVSLKEDVLKECIFQFANEPAKKKKTVKEAFHRAPRHIPKIETEPIEIEAPPAPKELNAQPSYLAIGPSLTMALPMILGCGLSIYSTRITGSNAGVFMYTGLVTAISSALIGTVWAIANMRFAKKHNKEDELKRFQTYSDYLIKCKNTIEEQYINNSEAMRKLYPSSAVCVTYNDQSSELWNRNSTHGDFLSYRLGTGEVPFQVDIKIPKEKFTMINDSLTEKPQLIKDNYANLIDVPVTVDLFRDKMIGVIGGPRKEGCYPIVYNLVAQIAAANCYTDVKMIFIYDEMQNSALKHWEFAKWLPHVWSQDKKMRYVAGNKSDAGEVFYQIVRVLRSRSEENVSYRDQDKVAKPYYILFAEDTKLLEDELILKYLVDKSQNIGISTVLLSEGYDGLPNECEFFIENTREFQGIYNLVRDEDSGTHIDFDQIAKSQLDAFARTLAPIEVNEVEVGGEIPDAITFFDMYGVNRLEDFNVIDRWIKNRTYESMKAAVGYKSGGAICYLDVHEKYHGPHGLVAGTTGSGKSETLQSYILSLALNYSPDDVGFFLIDYKGGGMANLFDNLPHLLGQISNLSGNQVHRAMVSIKSENLRRQRIFNEYGVNNINHYTRMYKNKEAVIPVPHMFIVIDEFAELKREEPDFMRELISVAQVGRSLGVHLILATQKPSGTVDDNIWSNSKFRLCLRVQDKQDSNDMLHKPDAAFITQAGRCYLQVGNDELFELFQSAWSGAVYDSEGESQTDIAKMIGVDGRTAIVGSFSQKKRKEKARLNWIKLLIELMESFNQSDDASDDSTSGATRMRNMIDYIFEELSNYKIMYEVNDYNERRLQDLINVYESIKNSLDPNTGIETLTESVIQYADLKRIKLPEIKERSQLDALVDYLREVAEENGYEEQQKLWLPVLPTQIFLDQLEGYDEHAYIEGAWPDDSQTSFTLRALIGMADDPVNQAQYPIAIDVAESGNYAVIGNVSSGKSTLLQTYVYSLVNRYNPDRINLYLLDYSSKRLASFESYPHVGGIVFEDESEKAAKLFNMLLRELDRRKRLFRGGDYSQFVRANGYIEPAIMVVIDNYASFRARTEEAHDDCMMTLAKEGINNGIYLMISGGGFSMSDIPAKLGDSLKSVITLQMNDKYGYTDALRTMHLDVLPEQDVQGRGLAKVAESHLEYQAAQAIDAVDDFERGELISQAGTEMAENWDGKVAMKIPVIPEHPTWDEYEKEDGFNALVETGDYLPVGYDKESASAYGINLANTYCYTIVGKNDTGKTNALRLAMKSASVLGGRMVVIDFGEDFASLGESLGATVIRDQMSMVSFFEELTPEIKERGQLKKDCEAQGMREEEIYAQIKERFEKIFIFIGDLGDFIISAHQPEDGIKTMDAFLVNILTKGSNLNIYFIGRIDIDDVSNYSLSRYSVFTTYMKYHTGMHLGGSVGNHPLFSFEFLSFTEQNATEKLGIAMLPMLKDENTRRIVIPEFLWRNVSDDFSDSL